MDRFRWPQSVLETVDLPAEAKSFLADEGLPSLPGLPAVEFGLFDSDHEFVI